MKHSEKDIIDALIQSWVPLGLEFASGASEITAVYIYAASELGNMYANAFYEQNERVLYPDDVAGPNTGRAQVREMQRYLRDDLKIAEKRFEESKIPCPTEYRVIYEPGPGRLDVQLSHELKYIHHPVKTLEHGPEDWLDGRLEKHFGKLIPPESEWPAVRPPRGE